MRAARVFFTHCVFSERVKDITSPLTKIGLLAVMSVFAAMPASAQQQGPKKIGLKVSFDKTEFKVGDTVELIFTANLPNGYHLYSEKSDCPADDGPIRAEIRFDHDDNARLLGDLQGKGDTLMNDPIWGCSTGEFHGKCEFRQKVVIKAALNGLMGHFQGQVCSEDGTCYLMTEDISVALVAK